MSDGSFDWIRRMGVHEAYHTSPMNRIFHWVCIPFELFGVVKLLSFLPFPFVGDAAVLLLLLITPIYLLADIFCGALFMCFMSGLYLLGMFELKP